MVWYGMVWYGIFHLLHVVPHVSSRDKLYISMHNNDMNKLTLRIIDTIKKIVVDASLADRRKPGNDLTGQKNRAAPQRNPKWMVLFTRNAESV